jgi:hypothetical protein
MPPGKGSTRLTSRLANAAAVIAGASDKGRDELLRVKTSQFPPAAARTTFTPSHLQCNAWGICMAQLQAHAQPMQSFNQEACMEVDEDTCDCIEWLAVLAAEVPGAARDFSAQLLESGLEQSARTIMSQLQNQRRSVAVSSLARCCGSIIRGTTSGADVIMTCGTASALLSQLKLQASLSHESGSSAAIISICTVLVSLIHGFPSRARLLFSAGAAACAAAALSAKGSSAAAAAAAAQFATVRCVKIAR